MLFVVCIIVRFSSRKRILANFSHPSILGLAVWPGELRHLHGLATAESCWQSFGYKKHLGKGQRFLFSFFLEPEKRPKGSKRHQQARIERAVRILSPNSGPILCAKAAELVLVGWSMLRVSTKITRRLTKEGIQRRDAAGFRLFGLCSARNGVKVFRFIKIAEPWHMLCIVVPGGLDLKPSSCSTLSNKPSIC